MTSKERIECAMNLEKPDRIPIGPLMNTSAAAALTGVEYWEIARQGYYAQLETETHYLTNSAVGMESILRLRRRL